MPEPMDRIVPMLQRLQSDVSEIKQDVTRIAVVEQRMESLEECFDAIGTYITYTMGLHAQNKVDAGTNSEEITAIKQRLDALEAARGT